MITKPKLLLITGIAITIVAFGLGVWAATITAPTSIKIIQCMREKNPNQTFTGLDADLVWYHNSSSSYRMDST